MDKLRFDDGNLRSRPRTNFIQSLSGDVLASAIIHAKYCQKVCQKLLYDQDSMANGIATE